jgi:hypothetical protein
VRFSEVFEKKKGLLAGSFHFMAFVAAVAGVLSLMKLEGLP